jgi:hypothetical protein
VRTTLDVVQLLRRILRGKLVVARRGHGSSTTLGEETAMRLPMGKTSCLCRRLGYCIHLVARERVPSKGKISLFTKNMMVRDVMVWRSSRLGVEAVG